jgi:D-alanyl-D-alanine carboxypeptidase/D-alanyl-D-alanine-endopeptidase (penicillin-binding protein 4)
MTDAYEAHFRRQPQIHSDLELLADRIVGAGVTAINGRLVGDESRYDTERYVDAWPDRFIAQDQTGPLSALTVNDGFTAFPPSPDLRVPDEEPAPDPAAYSADQLRRLLVARGVSVGGAAASGAAPEGAVDVAQVDSPPMSQLVTQMLRESDNMTAELLTKELGRVEGDGGTTAAGTAVIAEVAAEADLPTPGTLAADGSGLAGENRQTCALVQSILDAQGPGSVLAGGLAVAGQNGTLELRLQGTPIDVRLRAKTGTLNQVAALAGYMESAQGSQLSFSFIVNVPEPERVTDDEIARQDELALILLGYPEVPDLASLGPKPVAG